MNEQDEPKLDGKPLSKFEKQLLRRWRKIAEKRFGNLVAKIHNGEIKPLEITVMDLPEL